MSGQPPGTAVLPADKLLAQLPGLSAHSILIDCTATASVVPHMVQWVAGGGSVVMANKKPLTGPQADFDALVSASGDTCGYESTVGAGTPFVASLRRLVAAGDTVSSVMGTFSGTLGFLMAGLQAGEKGWGELVNMAHDLGSAASPTPPLPLAVRAGFWLSGCACARVRVNVRAHASVCALSGLGVLVLTRLVDCRYTEPDPRDDLSGSDVARKALIMARTLGWEFEMDQIEVESLFSTDMAELSVADFKQAIGKLDGEMSAKRDAADADGKVLRYVASCSKDGLKVGLQAVPKDSPLGLLSGPDNMMVVSSALYADRPLVVQGAGAGDDVTAAGVVADCVDLARSARIAGTSV